MEIKLKAGHVPPIRCPKEDCDGIAADVSFGLRGTVASDPDTVAGHGDLRVIESIEPDSVSIVSLTCGTCNHTWAPNEVPAGTAALIEDGDETNDPEGT
jgi:hypothetical protein